MGLIGNLKAHEMEKKVIEDKVLPKRKNVAFKSTSILSDDNEDINNEEDNDEQLTLSQECEKNVSQQRTIQHLQKEEEAR